MSRYSSYRGAENTTKSIAMFALTAENTFHLYSHPTDMRKSFDALSGLVRNNFGSNPTGGEVFIFINKRRDKIKLLHWEGSGYLLYYKRLEKGTFEIPRYDASVGSITPFQLLQPPSTSSTSSTPFNFLHPPVLF